MVFNSKLHNRRSIRFAEYNYSNSGLYFVTICVQDRYPDFGKVENGKMILSNIGKCVENCLLEIKNHYPDTELHEYIVMPDHVHFIVEIRDGVGNVIENETVGVQKLEPSSLSQKGVVTPAGKGGGVIPVIKGGGIIPAGVQDFEPQRIFNKFQKIIPRSLGAIIRGLKIGVKKWCNQNNFEYFQWQRNYYERIVRDEREYLVFSNYIRNNPFNWTIDKANKK